MRVFSVLLQATLSFAAAAAAVLFLAPSPANVDKASASTLRAIEALRSEMARLRARQPSTIRPSPEPERDARLVARVDALSESLEALLANAHPTPIGPSLPESEAAAAPPRFAETIEHLDAEPVDPAWSQIAETDLRTSFTQLEIEGFSLNAATCRSTHCRLDIFGAGEEAPHLLPALGLVSPWAGPMELKSDLLPDGSVRATLIVARDGHSLPGVERPSTASAAH